MGGRSSMAAHHRTARVRRLAWVVMVLATACSRRAAGDRGADSRATAAPVPRAPAFDSLAAVARAIAPDGPYRVVSVSNPGTITGRISLDARPPRHDTTLTGDDASVCGARVRDGSVETSGRYLEGALVWVSDVHAGRPLPAMRRADLQIVRCQFEPRMLALVQGTTINLQSKDDAVHRTRFYSESTDSLLSRMLTVNRWAVVPSARIAAEPGFVRVRLTRHQFVRGFVAVFDHPYFAVTNRAGRYRIPGVPAGTYHVRVWHERGGDPIERTVTVKPGKQVEFDTTLVLH